MKRQLKYYLKNLMLVERNHEWLVSDIELKQKAAYYPDMAWAFARLLATGKKSINYLGHDFVFDNPATPFNLQNYPFEITKKILANMDFKPKTVLDVGGNLGQFSVTIKYVLGDEAKIDIFEPNKDIFPLLQHNVSSLKNAKTFNYALGENNSSTKMFFEVGRSGTGSMVKQNASDKQDSLNEIDVQMISSIVPLTKRNEYDLVKVDVEGYEMHVLKMLKDIKMKYLFVEVSAGRSKDYLHSEFFDTIAKLFGQFDIVHSTNASKNNDTYDVLIKF